MFLCLGWPSFILVRSTFSVYWSFISMSLIWRRKVIKGICGVKCSFLFHDGEKREPCFLPELMFWISQPFSLKTILEFILDLQMYNCLKYILEFWAWRGGKFSYVHLKKSEKNRDTGWHENNGPPYSSNLLL